VSLRPDRRPGRQREGHPLLPHSRVRYRAPRWAATRQGASLVTRRKRRGSCPREVLLRELRRRSPAQAGSTRPRHLPAGGSTAWPRRAGWQLRELVERFNVFVDKLQSVGDRRRTRRAGGVAKWAEGVGFEPTGLITQGFSRPSHSSALPSLPATTPEATPSSAPRCAFSVGSRTAPLDAKPSRRETRLSAK